MDIEFTREEISAIEKKLGYIVFDWAKHLVNHIVSQARRNNVEKVYINSVDTLDSGNTSDDKTAYFYEKLPKMLGFQEVMVDLRGKGEERLWELDMTPSTVASIIEKFIRIAERSVPMDKIHPKYQGAFISIVGKKPEYSETEFRRVLEILEKRQARDKEKNKAVARYFYDWGKEWTGDQRFSASINEEVVMQKLPDESQQMIMQDPALMKFWSFMLSQHQHFDSDTIGFALVSKINTKAWVINEIQTDCISKYLQVRRLDTKKGEVTDGIADLNTLKDMLHAQNRSNLVPAVESNGDLAAYLMAHPNLINELPDNTQNFNEWVYAQREGGANRELMQYFASVNFNSRIYRRH